MKIKDFDRAIEIILAEEGGLVDHPKDPGRITYRGISWAAVCDLRDETVQLEFDLDGDGDVDRDDFLELKRLFEAGDTEKVVEFYRVRYWEASGASKLKKWPVALIHFDGAVNHGVRTASVMLQKAARVIQDGIVGPRTIAAVHALPPALVFQRYWGERAWLYHRLSVRRGDDFYRGWMNRLFRIHVAAARRPR